MAGGSVQGCGHAQRLVRSAALTASLMLGACAQLGGLDKQPPEAALTKDEAGPKVNQSDLQKAVEYWGKQHEKNPTDLKAALNYTRNLKAIGEKERALAVLQNASIFHGQDRELQSEYGRLALDLDQLSLAQKLLEAADDPAKPDWRVVNARGAALAKQGAYSQAIPLFERAAAVAPSQLSIVNNLAMAYAADGRPDRAEQLLRQASAQGGDAKVRQNLALVLGLQGKYDEAKQIGARDSNQAVVVAHDVDYLRKMVRHQPHPAPAETIQQAVATPEAKKPEVVQAKAKAKSQPAPLRGTTDVQASAAPEQGWATQVARSEPAVGLKSTKP